MLVRDFVIPGGHAFRKNLSEKLNFVMELTELTTGNALQPEEEDMDTSKQEVYLLKSVTVDSEKTLQEITVRLHRIDFYEKATLAHLTVGNNSKEVINFFSIKCAGVQQRRQFRGRSTSLNSEIPPSIDETGWVSFTPLDPSMSTNSKFVFYILGGGYPPENYFITM